MRYYFPSIITSLNFPRGDLRTFHTVNSGENAIRLLLRSYRLQEGAKVALPVYVCDSLKQAVYKEGLRPLYLDLKTDQTFWADYNANVLSSQKVAAVILVHLYGFVHPDTNHVMEFCQTHGLPLIHDAAQSFGIDESLFKFGSGTIYSFGPGKSSTAAGGAIVLGLSREFYRANCREDSNVFNRNARAKLFLKSRIYGYQLSLADKLLNKLVHRFELKDAISEMIVFQQAAAAAALQLVRTRAEERKIRYRILKKAANANDLLNVPYNDEKGLCFKFVLSVKKDISAFRQYLKKNDVPFFSLKDSLQLDRDKHVEFPVFCGVADSFIELSSEASLPIDEIKRLANVLMRYADNVG